MSMFLRKCATEEQTFSLFDGSIGLFVFFGFFWFYRSAGMPFAECKSALFRACHDCDSRDLFIGTVLNRRISGCCRCVVHAVVVSTSTFPQLKQWISLSTSRSSMIVVLYAGIHDFLIIRSLFYNTSKNSYLCPSFGSQTSVDDLLHSIGVTKSNCLFISLQAA